MRDELIEKKKRYADLLSIYGKVLTESVLKRMEEFYLSDLSLKEISQNEGVSRNAVFESIKHGEEELDYYEDKLHIYKKIVKIAETLDKFKGDEMSREDMIKTIEGELDYGI